MTNVIGCDVSFWQDDNSTQRKIDFLKMKNAGAGFVIIRSGQNLWVDPDFASYWQAAKAVKIPRGSYFFYDSRANPTAQAELWAEQFNGDFGELPLFADFEESYGGPYGGWQNYKIFLERIKKLAITKEIGIYTGFYHWKDLGIPTSEQFYFTQFPLWIAAYNNVGPQIPAPWTNWTFWQYSDDGDGAKYGVESNSVDMNQFRGDLAAFNSRFQLDNPDVRPLDTESHTNPFEGVEHHRVFRQGSWCSIVVIDPQKMGFTVTPFNMRTTSQAANELGAQITINGGAHTALRAIGLHVSEGKYLATQSEYEPFINFTASQVPQVEYYDSHVPLYNALAGKRMIVEYGQVSVNNSAAWYEVHPRTLAGMDALGRVVFCTIDGRQPPYSVGADLFQAAQIMVEYGCVRALDLDGGGSTTLVVQQPDLSQKVMNYPIDNGVVGKERVVGNHIAVFTGDIVIPPIGENMYKVLVAVKPRIDHSMYATSAPVNLGVGTEFESSGQFTVNDPSRVDNGVTFVQIVGGSYNQYWVPLIYNNVEYVKAIGVVDPPQATHTVDVIIDGVNVFHKDLT